MVNAWQEVHSSVTVPQQWKAIHCDFDAPLDIRSFSCGYPGTARLDWSRARHFGPIKCPLRTRAHPLGLPNLATSAQTKIHDANLAVEVSTWLAAEALQCEASSVTAVLLFPEDLGGHSLSGPTSPWSLKEWRDVEGQLGDGADSPVPTSSAQLVSSQTFSSYTLRRFLAGPHTSCLSTGFCTTVHFLSHAAAPSLIHGWWVSLTSICSTRQLCSVSRTASGCACGVRFWKPKPLKALGVGHLLGLPGLRLLVPRCRRAQALFPGCTRRGAIERSRERIFVTWAPLATSRSTSPATPTSSLFLRAARLLIRSVLPFCWVVGLLSLSRFLALLCCRAPCLAFLLATLFFMLTTWFLRTCRGSFSKCFRRRPKGS